MSRLLPVLIILVVVSAGLGLAFWRCVECPDCPAEGPCIRCRDHGRITLLESRRRIPLAPPLRSLLRSRGYASMFAGTLAESQGLSQEHYLGWKGQKEFFYYAETTLVDGPDGPLVLTVLTPKVSGRDDDSGHRVLLFDRKGRELDRCDISMPGTLVGVETALNGGPTASIVVKASERQEQYGGMGDRILFATGSTTVTLNRQEWPPSWRYCVARIVARDGRLHVLPP